MEKLGDIYYLKSHREVDEDLVSLLERQTRVIVIDSIRDIDITSALLILVDMRDEDHGEAKFESLSKTSYYSQMPIIAVCEKMHYSQYLVATKYDKDILDLPIDKKTIIRRCNRVFKKGVDYFGNYKKTLHD